MNALAQFKMEMSILEDYVNSPKLFHEELVNMAKSIRTLEGFREASEEYSVVETIAYNLQTYLKNNDAQTLSILKQNVRQFLNDTKGSVIE
ncbi:MAG: hypothetical protein JXR48_00555 [Candidatus Delongbacteria bacterium]|nr:hypothetical protein [Candidatus Delongbacteria bacterium]MBN2833432.1 hypothetical protein [Candidatus Delongbacteria bacterium]